jgi:hypothetical protein
MLPPTPTPTLMRVTVEFEWDIPGMNRPYTKVRYDFPMPTVKTAQFTTGPHPTHASYVLDVREPINRPVVTETVPDG